MPSSQTLLVQDMLDAAIAAVDNYLGFKVAAADNAEVYDGQNTDYLKTWSRPVNSIDAITINYGETNETEINGSEFKFDSWTGIIKYKRTSVYGPVFEQGFQNILVEYASGWEEEDIPKDILQAYGMICTSLYKQSGANSADLIMKRKVGDVVIEYASVWSPFQISLNSPWLGDVREILSYYKNRRPN